MFVSEQSYTKILSPEMLAHLTMFEPRHFKQLGLTLRSGRPYLKCLVTNKFIRALDNEVIRQLLICWLISDYGYSRDLVELDIPVRYKNKQRKFSFGVLDHSKQNVYRIVFLVVPPENKLNASLIEDMLKVSDSVFGVLTDGASFYYCYVTITGDVVKVNSIPRFSETPEDVFGRHTPSVSTEPVEKQDQEDPKGLCFDITTSFTDSDAEIANYFFLGWGAERTAQKLGVSLTTVSHIYEILVSEMQKISKEEVWSSNKDVKKYVFGKQLDFMAEALFVKMSELRNTPCHPKDLRSYLDLLMKTLIVKGSLNGFVSKTVNPRSSVNPAEEAESIILPVDMSFPEDDSVTDEAAKEAIIRRGRELVGGF